MAELGYHDGYLYPHDYPGHFTPQQYMPDALRDTVFWHPADNPAEQRAGERMNQYWPQKPR